MQTEVSLSQQELEQLNTIAENLGKPAEEIVGELIRQYFRYFDGVEKLKYAVVLRGGNGNELISYIDSEEDFVHMLAYEMAGMNEYDEAEMEARAREWVKNIPEDGSAIPYYGSEKFGVRLATDKEKYSYILAESKELEATAPLTDYILNGGVRGMIDRLSGLTDPF